MADTEPTHTVTLTDPEVAALRDAMNMARSDCEGVPAFRDMIDALPGIHAKLDAAQGVQEETR